RRAREPGSGEDIPSFQHLGSAGGCGLGGGESRPEAGQGEDGHALAHGMLHLILLVFIVRRRAGIGARTMEIRDKARKRRGFATIRQERAMVCRAEATKLVL